MRDDGPYEQLAADDRSWFWHPSTQMQEYASADPTVIVSGRGYKLTDYFGNEYIDGNSGVWCVALGYSDRRLIEAAQGQLAELPFTSLSAFTHRPAIELAARLAKLASPDPYRVFFTTDGAAAVECALKMTRQYFRQNGAPTRHKVISLRGSYHGLTFGALSASGVTNEKRKFEPLMPGFSQVAPPDCLHCSWRKTYGSCGFECIEAVKREIEYHDPESVAAILIEPILASGGVVIPPPEYLPAVAALARDCGALLIFDEVTTGFGRTGDMFAYQRAGVVPDIITLSKAMTSGYMPLGAVIAAKHVFDGFLGTTESGRAFAHFHTFGGHPVSCAVALATLDAFDSDRILENVRAMGQLLCSRLRELKEEQSWITDVRGVGMMYGIEFADPESRKPLERAKARAISKAAMKQGLIIRSLRDVPEVLVLFPPLIIDEHGINSAVERLRAAIQDVLPSP